MNVLIAAEAAKRRFRMKTFTIDNETNTIIVHATIQDADAVTNAERFRNEAGLAKLVANWPAARLVEIWNSLPGETPVKKFRDRATAVSRIWKAIQSLSQAATAAADESGPLSETAPVTDQIEEVTPQPGAVIPESAEPAVAAPVAPHAPNVTPQESAAKKKATRAKKTPVAAANGGAPREG